MELHNNDTDVKHHDTPHNKEIDVIMTLHNKETDVIMILHNNETDVS